MRHSYILILVIASLFTSCKTDKKPTLFSHTNKEIDIDLDDIVKRGKIKVVTDYNSTNYFVYKGRPLGYQFELLKAMSNQLGLKLEITVSNNVEENINNLFKWRYRPYCH